MKAFYILDGKKVKEQDITFSHLKRGFLYGDGVFETLRAKGNKIFMWDEHIRRLKKGADVCGLQLSKDNIGTVRADIEELLKNKRISDAYIRLNLWREKPDFFDPYTEKKPHILVIIKEHHPYPENFYREGIRCIVSKNYFKNEKSPLVYIKSLNYLENILARIEAKKNSCEDAVLLNTSGYIASATVSNIFFVRKGIIHTPSLDCGILKGTIKGLILKICSDSGITAKEGRFTVRDLKRAEEVFFTNTLIGVLSVREIKGIFKGENFTLASFLREAVDKKITG